MDNLVEKYLGEFAGKGMATKINVQKKDEKKVLALFKQLKIDYTKDSKGNIMVGDDDLDKAEEMVARKLNILI